MNRNIYPWEEQGLDYKPVTRREAPDVYSIRDLKDKAVPLCRQLPVRRAWISDSYDPVDASRDSYIDFCCETDIEDWDAEVNMILLLAGTLSFATGKDWVPYLDDNTIPLDRRILIYER